MDVADNKYFYYKVAEVGELSENGRLLVEIYGLAIVIIRTNNTYFALGDICTHDGGPLGEGELIDCQIVCPRHGARFDLQTGKALTLPAVEDTPSYPVIIKDGTIEVGIPVEKLND